MNFTDIEISERMQNSPVLIVDDAEFNRTIIIEILNTIGIKHITAVGSGKECLEALKTLTPGIIILDLMMPEMDGFECIKRIRAQEHLADVPIIVQTAMGDADERLRAFHDGANDLLMKPINPYELVARIKMHSGYQHVLTDLKVYQERVRKELDMAREMQNGMLPTQEEHEQLHDSHQLAVSSVSKSSSEVGGDLWGMKVLNEKQIAVYIYDISGHGVAAAINAVRVHILFQPEDLQTSPPSTVLEKLNAQLFEQFAANEFATFFIGVIDLDKNTLDYAVAASTESLVLNREADEVRHLEQAGLPAGATANATYETHSVAFNEGDTLMIYSDALIETTTKDSGTFLPISEVTDVFKRHMRSRSAPAKQLQERALYETLGRIGANEDDVPLNDDLTLALLTRVSN